MASFWALETVSFFGSAAFLAGSSAFAGAFGVDLVYAVVAFLPPFFANGLL